jgi:hypothetical protein
MTKTKTLRNVRPVSNLLMLNQSIAHFHETFHVTW